MALTCLRFSRKSLLFGDVINSSNLSCSWFLPRRYYIFRSISIALLTIHYRRDILKKGSGSSQISSTSSLRCVEYQNLFWVSVTMSSKGCMVRSRESEIHIRRNSLLFDRKQRSFRAFSLQLILQKVWQRLRVWVFMTFSFRSPPRRDELPNWSFASDISNLRLKKNLTRLNFMQVGCRMIFKLHFSQYF